MSMMEAHVWLSFEFTYLSNGRNYTGDYYQFDYPLNLHISQTRALIKFTAASFDYPLNLHISQTGVWQGKGDLGFDYPLNLHISQT